MGLQTFYGKGPHQLLWAGSRAERGRITVTGISNCPNYCEMFIVYSQFTVVSTGRVIPPGGLRVGDPRCNPERTKMLICGNKLPTRCNG